MGVSVDRGAHLNAPNSLSGTPADVNLRRAESTLEPLREREVGR
jgi:hypothetical protein